MTDFLSDALDLVTDGPCGSGNESLPPPIPVDDLDYYHCFPDLTPIKESWIQDPAFIPTTIAYSITFTLGVVGNSLVVFALLGDRKARNVTSSFLVSLAVADLVFLMICVPYESSKKFMSYWAGGRILCKVAGFVEMLTAAASVLNLTAVSVERYVVIVHPMRSRGYCTLSNSVKIIVGVWIAAILIASPSLHIMDTQIGLYYNRFDYVTMVTCSDSNTNGPMDRVIFAWYQLAIMFIIPVIVMVYCYSIVIHVLWISTKELAKMTQTNNSVRQGVHHGNTTDEESRQRLTGPTPNRHAKTLITRTVKDHSTEVREARKQVIKMLLTIIGIFFVCWGPRLALNLMKRHNLSYLHTNSAFWVNQLFIQLFPYCQSCMNPIIYSFMSKNFRRSMRTSCRVTCHCDPYSCCEQKRGKVNEFDMESKTMNGTSRTYSPSRAYRSTNYSTVMSEC